MRNILLFLALVFACWPTNAAAQFKVLGEAEMKWPGIRYQIFWLERIPPDRLVVGIRMLATSEAPAGTLVGYPATIPPGLTPQQISFGDYRPRPFSLASSVMIDDPSKQQYPTLTAISPPGKAYFPDQVIASLTPGKALNFSIQFKVPPPPPPPAPGQPPVKQTLTFMLTNAKDAIKNIPIPPLVPAAK